MTEADYSLDNELDDSPTLLPLISDSEELAADIKAYLQELDLDSFAYMFYHFTEEAAARIPARLSLLRQWQQSSTSQTC